MDLHAENVIRTPDGPVLIDWSYAATALRVAIPRGGSLGRAGNAVPRLFLAGFRRRSHGPGTPQGRDDHRAPAGERHGTPARRAPSLAR